MLCCYNFCLLTKHLFWIFNLLQQWGQKRNNAVRITPKAISIWKNHKDNNKPNVVCNFYICACVCAFVILTDSSWTAQIYTYARTHTHTVLAAFLAIHGIALDKYQKTMLGLLSFHRKPFEKCICFAFFHSFHSLWPCDFNVLLMVFSWNLLWFLFLRYSLCSMLSECESY